jgi:RNA polymerase sigma-70 factor (ECF subfamily)
MIPMDENMPDDRWAEAVVHRARERLRHEFGAAGRGTMFEELQRLLSEPPSVGESDVGVRLGLSVAAVRLAIHRLRGRFQQLVREEVAQASRNPEGGRNEERN